MTRDIGVRVALWRRRRGHHSPRRGRRCAPSCSGLSWSCGRVDGVANADDLLFVDTYRSGDDAAVSAILLAVAALAATSLPAARRADPIVALRLE
jgi:hypothetical protein